MQVEGDLYQGQVAYDTVLAGRRGGNAPNVL